MKNIKYLKMKKLKKLKNVSFQTVKLNIKNVVQTFNISGLKNINKML